MKFSKSILALVLLSYSLATQNLGAYWGDEHDASVEVLKNKITYDVKANGNYVVTINQRVKILDESARKSYSVQHVVFDKSRSHIRILKALTILERDRFPIDSDKIEIKTVASKNGFQEMYQAMIPFEHATIGSILQLKYEIDYFAPSTPNYFHCFQGLNEGRTLWRHAIFEINSELPLFTKFNDPTNSLQIEKDDSKPFRWTVSLIKPHARFLAGEPDDSFIEPAEQTYCSFSSEVDFYRIGRYFGTKYEQVLLSKLPEKLQSIFLICQKTEDETQQMNAAVSHIIEAIHYLGSWNTAQGHLFPRPLDEIAKTGYGDCKEYTVCLAAILRELGHQANPALVKRGEVYCEYDEPAALDQFNHIIVKAIGKSGKIYWIDPTNTVTMIDGIFPDIADRPALVLHPEAPLYERIPKIDYRKNKSHRIESIVLEPEDNQFKQKRMGTLEYMGERAIRTTSRIFSNPTSVAENIFIKILCDYQNPITKKITIPKEQSREVKNITIEFQLEEYANLLRTNYGTAILFDHNVWSQGYLQLSEKNQGSFYFGAPGTMVIEKIYCDLKSENLDELSFEIHSPWVNVKFCVNQTEKGIKVILTLEKLKSIIYSKELKSDEFQTLRRKLQQYSNPSALIFSKTIYHK